MALLRLETDVAVLIDVVIALLRLETAGEMLSDATEALVEIDAVTGATSMLDEVREVDDTEHAESEQDEMVSVATLV